MAQIITDNQHYSAIADAIRTKNETDTLYLPSEMANAILEIQGGVELNFKVVGGTTQPTNPKENTLWINTNTAITNYVFSMEEPSSKTEGMVWFKLGFTGTIGFEAINNNANLIKLHPVTAYQRISGVWQEKQSSIYKENKWTIFRYILYVLKNKAIDPAIGSYINVASSPMSNGVIQATRNDGTGNYGYFSSRITLNGNFKTLRVHANVTNVAASSSTTYLLRVGVSSTAMASGTYNSNIGKFNAYKALNVGNQWANIDISGLSGSYYISFCGVASFTIDEIVLTSEVL